MTTILPIAISILRYGKDYLFIRREKPPYEGLWSLVGGKISEGEHIRSAAIREVMEETGAQKVDNYDYRGVVSERLVDANGRLMAHFLIFVSYAEIDRCDVRSSEGALGLFSEDLVLSQDKAFLPSDWFMFRELRRPRSELGMYEAELARTDSQYSLIYFREAGR
ncbi:MAG: NUDIX domain-containing protein [Candidatus Thorarchaeota archaeon]|nr:NUDIX domain-containing protein [Candidatus Thorarchaeota archaeon]